MQWHLLNQLYVNLDYQNSVISVFEEVVSSELQLVQVLVSGMVCLETMNSVYQRHSNQIELTEESRL